MSHRASLPAPVPRRVLTAARLECLLETRLNATTPRRASPRCTTPNFRTKIGDFPHQPPPKTF